MERSLNSKRIFLSPPHFEGNELDFVRDALNNDFSLKENQIYFFEQELAKYLDGNICLTALNSGTAAIHLAIILSGVTVGDEVICQSFTFSASANPIIYQGATPVFIDSEKDTWNMCPKLLEKAIEDRISKGKKTKAIIVVHLYGIPARINEIAKIARKYNIPLIEDAAEALGSIYKGGKCGTFGDFGVLSFNGNKIITTSGGGALICKNNENKQKAIFLATQARDDAPHYQHSQIGYNYRMSNIVAGIGRGQMKVLDDRVNARRANFEFYKKNLSEIQEISFLEEPNGYYSNRWLTCILTPSFEKREKIRVSLQKENIESRPLWKPMHLQPVFQNCPSYENGISEELFEKGLCLPSGSDLTNEQLSRIVKIIKESFVEKRSPI